jgi:hypothetical protein
MSRRWMLLAVAVVVAARSSGAQLRRTDSARQVTRFDSARQQGCVTGEIGGGAKCPREFRLVVDTRITGYQSDDSSFAKDVRTAVRIAVMRAGFYPLTLRNANVADSALYVILDVKRAMQLDREGFEVRGSLGGREAPARSCEKPPVATAAVDPGEMRVTFGVLLADVIEEIARCAQRVRSATRVSPP